MVFTSRDNLTVLKINDSEDRVSFKVLEKLITERPSNMIYCVDQNGGVLRGIISMGDIHRAAEDGADSVAVNTRFTRLNGYEYMRARQLFLDNEKINALPIVDSENKLIGDYSRWDDQIDDDTFEYLKDEKYVKLFKETIKRAAFVECGQLFPKKRENIALARHYFENIGIETEVVKWQDIIGAFDRIDAVLFADEDECRAINTLYRDVLGKGEEWDLEDFKYYNDNHKYRCTIKGILSTINEKYKDLLILNVTIGKLNNSGVRVLPLQFIGKSDYYDNLYEMLRKKYSDLNIEFGKSSALPDKYLKDFFPKAYSLDMCKLFNPYSARCVKSGGVVKLKDCNTDLYNVTNGERLTVGQQKEYQNTIYFYGPCFILGAFVEDSHTIESYLQGIINEAGYNFRVVNYGAYQEELYLLNKICTTEYKEGDIVVFYDKNKRFEGIPSLNLMDCLERENVTPKWFTDGAIHCNYKVNEIYAKEIYSFIKGWLDEKSTNKAIDMIEEPMYAMAWATLKRYFPDYNTKGSVGSIVMNCNPFTYGHRYLIEQALKQVDNLIIFVVEEDKSLFTFAERYAMVREGTKDLENVKIVPSGNFILSQTTFPEYFIKIEDENLEKNVEEDITLFAEAIAPQLNITYRFVGEEKSDKVTDAYNSAMKRILPEHGVKVVEIPRKVMDNGAPISATEVRKHLETYPFGDLSELLPESTQRLLVQSWEKDKSFK